MGQSQMCFALFFSHLKVIWYLYKDSNFFETTYVFGENNLTSNIRSILEDSSILSFFFRFSLLMLCIGML